MGGKTVTRDVVGAILAPVEAVWSPRDKITYTANEVSVQDSERVIST